MNIVNLKKYIKDWLIVRNLDEKDVFDAIIYEQLPDLPEDKISKHNIQTFQDLSYDFGSSWKLLNLSSKHDNILIILDKLNPEYLIPFISQAQSDYTIINTSFGVGNFSNNKNYLSPDIGIMSNYPIDTYNPYDFISFFQALTSKWSNYIQISNREIPMNLLENSDQDQPIDPIIDLRQYECSWDTASILSVWSCLSPSIKATQKLNEDSLHFDLFGIYNYDFEVDKWLKESLESTQHLILVLETSLQDLYLKTIKSKLRDQNLINTKIDIVYPQAKNIKSSIKESIYHEANFDTEGIYNQIKDKFE